MKKKLTIPFLLIQLFFYSNLSIAQSPIEGNWTGTLYQNPFAGNMRSEYKFSMRLKEHNGEITGVSTIIAGPNFGILDLKGSFKNGTLIFEEHLLKKEKMTENFSWCFKSGTLLIKTEGKHLMLEGNWTGYSMYGSVKNICSPGKIVLTKEQGFRSLKGFVVNENTIKPIMAFVRIVNKNTGKEEAALNSTTGEFDIKLPESNEYELTVESKGYFTRYEHISMVTSQILNIPLKPIEIGQTIALKYILFEKSTSTLTKDSYPELERLSKFLIANPTVHIELQGHTSNEGDSNKNLELSEQRVTEIKNTLIQKGIDSKRVNTKAFGAQKPIASNDTEENRKLNRRVEFMILNK